MTGRNTSDKTGTGRVHKVTHSAGRHGDAAFTPKSTEGKTLGKSGLRSPYFLVPQTMSCSSCVPSVALLHGCLP
ncbi:hypothetical protein E2C01_032272 [Portunus trituberculatus]|uniref:Uncharacterized protein n=1 Tax=Portunus trituberculatus TaxID=210409 RepID=A0A5B7F0H9_PORTR|nr:hypothetical protein [Portunus trituberculatus]